ncbi:DNA adenine methylase [Termitidicoccus mucosus]|jgi:DNA adenine methylase|uniref:DNA methyltransferase n=1 Tax=Termitidicoccus mucosus TaxID=1184151 RepID=A0A178IJ92_9BACT|nr:DNA methyltransferase [Opitutaceae bacterium TSB47]
MNTQPDTQTLAPAKPVIGWAGGKTRLLKYLLPLIPTHTAYCEVFGGGLALFCAKQPSPVEIINDINGDLVSFYRCCKYHLDPVLDELDLVLNSRQDFEDYCQQPGLTEIQRAARWFIRNRLSFGGQGTSFAISRKQPLTSRAQRLVAIRTLSHRLDRTTIEHRNWVKIFELYDAPETFFFVDPPYLDSGGENYDGWSVADLTAFCERLGGLKGKWLFTFQDCEEVRSLMPGFRIKSIDRAKGIANKGGPAKRYKEVIITPR